jgi:hydroxymethylbilane synthase
MVGSTPVRQIRIATRTSELALWQAHHIKQKLIALHPDLEIALVPLKTEGDKIVSVSLAKIGGKSLFVKELEEALLKGDADMAVHSVKDMPAELPASLKLAVYCSREAPEDALIAKEGLSLIDLPPNPIIGTSSLRRQAQIKFLRPDCECRLLRGNVPTRLQKLWNGDYDAIILAVAGLERLGLAHHISYRFSLQEMLPAVGQGALGIECRADDKEILELLNPLNEPTIASCVKAERAMNAQLGGSCQTPIAGHAHIHEGKLRLVGRVLNSKGTVMLEGIAQGTSINAVSIGIEVAHQLLAQGAKKLIEESQC